MSAEQFGRLTVVQQIKQAFKPGGKMVAFTGLMIGGFVVLLEGVLTFVTNPYLSLAALAILVFVNAVSAACQLQVRKEAPTDIF